MASGYCRRISIRTLGILEQPDWIIILKINRGLSLSLCHGPWLLINANRIQNKHLTSCPSIQLDLENAGGKWVNADVHRCNTGGWVLITARCPEDIPVFNSAILKELEAHN